jgi:hypothetical protein
MGNGNFLLMELPMTCIKNSQKKHDFASLKKYVGGKKRFFVIT